MNNKKTTSQKVEARRLDIFITKIKNERFRIILGILALFFGIYLFLACISFFFYGAADQSKIENQSLWFLITNKITIRNWMGASGAYFSEMLVNKGFGLFAITIPITLAYIGLHQVLLRSIDWFKTIAITFFILIWGSLTCSLIVGKLDNWTHIIWGGAHGIVLEDFMERLIGIIGLIILLIVALLIFVLIIRKDSVSRVKNMLGKDSDHTTTDTPTQPIAETETSIKEQEGTEKESKSWLNKLKEKIEKVPHNNPIEANQEKEQEQEQEQEQNNTQSNSNNSTTTFDDFEINIPTEETIEFTEDEQPNITIPITENTDPLAEMEEYDPRADLSHFAFPSSSLLKVYEAGNKQVDMDEQNANKTKIINTLLNYGIEITSIKATVGPTITLYEIVPKAGVRISKIKNLEDDIALSLSALGIRIIAPMPGQGTVGIEVPNRDPQTVSMQSVIASKKFQEFKGALPVAIGKTITNETFVFDLAKLPHLLVAGATGQGKSVGLNAIITSLLYKKHPAEMKMVLVDPKMVEFSIYSAIEKHYLAKLPGEEKAIITDVSKVTQTLTSLTIEMDDRYQLLMKAGVRNIIEYNELFRKRRLSPKNGHKFLPYIVIVIDEFGDLIMTAGKEIEMPIARIAQKARAVGMHLIIATQRPTTNIITGTIKANFPARMAFRVMSQIDSRTILDTTGANQLIGRGDLLFSQGSDLVRIQCAFVDTPEVQDITSYIGAQQSYGHAHELPEFVPENSEGGGTLDMNDKDPLFEEVARLIVSQQVGSTSHIQRKFSIGYNRAGRLMDQMEAAGIVGAAQGSKPREVLIMDEYSLEQKLSSLNM